ncbi:MAG: hypothetical protein IJY39_14100 [Clostridia bacterium]|nr:hypothetical protein [Clostridia bacterium]
MKNIKLISFLLAIALVIPTLAACDSGKETATETDSALETVSETQTEAVTEATPGAVEKKDYGAEFYLSILSDVNPPDYYWVEESDNSAMSEAVFARQQKLYEWLGVEIINVGAGLNHMTYVTPFKTAVKNKDGSVDTLLSHSNTGVAGIVSEGYLRSFDDMSGIDLNSSYWNLDFMDSLAIADHHFLGFSDFNILYTNVVAFNKTMMDQYADAIDVPLYDRVRNNTWTLDKMIEIVNLVYIDATSDGKTVDDTFGLAGRQWVPWIGFMQACGIKLVDVDESGAHKISVMNELNKEKTSALVDMLTALTTSDNAYLDYMTTSVTSVPFTSGRVLLFLESTYGLVSFLDYDISFGVLPYPMWDEAQKDTVGYQSLQWGGYLCIPTYLENELMVGETLEVLAFYSDDVKITFYEKMLGKQVADVPDDKQMLDIIWESVCTDFGQTFSDEAARILFILPTVTWPESGQNLASYIAGAERTGNSTLEKFEKRVEKNYGK